jgi:hypothetical protein
MGQTLYDSYVTDAMTENDPLSANEIAAFIDGRLAGDDLLRVQSLLADDVSARKEVAEASRLIASAPDRNRMRARWLAIGGIAAVAAVALILIQPGDQLEESTRVASERRPTVEASDRIELVTPADGQQVGRSDVTLTWRSIDGATYRVVVSDPAGRMLFDANTSDTSVAVPLIALKLSNDLVYWSVDALAPDGSSVTSGVRAFAVTAK